MRNYESLVDALDDLRKRGYDADFEPQSNCLYCNNLDLRLYEEEFQVDEVYRFEGDSSADDSSVVYALTSTTGVRGTIVDGFGASAGNIDFDMARKLHGHSIPN
ncbi:phosphoribosylpyrophosphate synthetase [Pseudoflavitalea sp. G-6-1-2]|uniref:phosphoribosylpyrophosphate synthetase n=1 Tax=Pseudoflavitalea sp. G-6-1-2 TaxID=2728841 RepID=UPI00146A7865|nr:phosphoribosylpyrophosphate synthetase [Pseudoflavitalea sp. G-6-1-2]NML21301.1 phosphoribosylpyrophosphate synthetase [Pseudoflavitalea sp. G-6-1-2]